MTNSSESFGMSDRVFKEVGKGNEAFIKLTGIVNYKLWDAEGNLKGEWEIPNLITSAGKARVADLLITDVGSAAPAFFNYIAIGTGTNAAAAGDTTLQTEISTNGGQRTDATGTRVTTSVTNDTAQLVATFNFTGSFAVTESGVFDDISTGTLLARQVFSAINVASGDSLQVTWKIQVS